MEFYLVVKKKLFMCIGVVWLHAAEVLLHL